MSSVLQREGPESKHTEGRRQASWDKATLQPQWAFRPRRGPRGRQCSSHTVPCSQHAKLESGSYSADGSAASFPRCLEPMMQIEMSSAWTDSWLCPDPELKESLSSQPNHHIPCSGHPSRCVLFLELGAQFTPGAPGRHELSGTHSGACC